MFLREFFNHQQIIVEGGNLQIGDVAANRIDSSKRAQVVPIIDSALTAINASFKKANNNIPLWMPSLLSSKKFLAGSSFHFFNRLDISDADFAKVKRTVGDIDTQVDQNMADQVRNWLGSLPPGTQIGPAQFAGMDAKDPAQVLTLWKFPDIVVTDPAGKEVPITIQIDMELKPFNKGAPTPWAQFSASSEWNDLSQGVKGVFHKFIIRALSSLTQETFLLRKIGARKTTEKPTTDNMISFAVKSKEGGGLRNKFAPVIDPATGQQEIKDNLPVYTELPTSGYKQDISEIFTTIFGDRLPTKQVKSLVPKFWSFVGIIELMKDYLDPNEQQQVADNFLDIVFGDRAVLLYRKPEQYKQDLEEKNAAINKMYEILEIQPPANLEQIIANYEATRKNNPQPVTEAEQPAVKAQLRKGMPHLRDLKPADFLDLVDELRSEGGRFKLQNIPLNVKIDGFGGRFGKDANGRPFMATSRTEPRYKAGFLDYHKQKGTTDTEILGRAANFDKLFNEMMSAIKLVDSKLGPEFLINKQVTCEVLFLPFATQTDEGKLKFVGIEYDQLPAGVELVLVPFRIVNADTGEEIPNGDTIVQEIAELGQNGNVMFVSNRLVQKDGLDVTEIINPLENLEELKNIISGTAGKRDRASLQLRREIEEKLKPVQIALEKAIDEDPNIIGKDILGKNYEGIVINSRLGPIKVTSQRQKDIIAQKQALKKNARVERPRKNQSKTAVVAIGSFVGHKGHEELWNYTINKAKEVGGDPYLFIGNAVGADDPIPPATKVQTWHKMYPAYSDNISAVITGGSIMQKIKHELINPLPGKPPRYDNIIIMVGEDQAKMPIANALMKSVNKFPGYEHVKAQLEVTPRGTGMSFTKLRNILKDPNATPEQQYALWAQGFNEPKLGKDWILHLMDVSRKGMNIQQPNKIQERLLNSLIRRNSVGKIFENDEVKSLQQYLNTKGAQLNVDGILGPKTKTAIQQLLKGDKNYQQTAAGVSVSNAGLPIKTGNSSVNQTGLTTQSPAKVTPTTQGKDKTIVAVVNAGPGYTDVKTDDGEIQRREGTRAWRNNNPGNIEFSPYAKSKGAVGTDGRYAVFPTLNLGFNAKKELLFSPTSKYINLSIHDAMHKYAPSTENDTAKYIQVVTKATGTTPDTTIKDLTPSQQEQMLNAINRMEGFKVGKINVLTPATVAEKMLPKSAFAGTGAPTFHKLGSAAQAKGSQKGPVKKGQLVGGSAESIENTLAEDYEKIMSSLIERIIYNELRRP